MSAAAFGNAMALLAVVAAVGAVVAVVARIRGRGPDGQTAMVLALGVASVATAGSLVFSEVYGFTPCRLCWWQRFAMYPLVPILGIALWRRSLGVRWIAVPLALAGAGIATWHVMIQRLPQMFAQSVSCDATAPCAGIWVRALGGIFTIPTLALVGFIAIAAVLLSAHRDADDLPATGTDSTHLDSHDPDTDHDTTPDEARTDHARHVQT